MIQIIIGIYNPNYNWHYMQNYISGWCIWHLRWNICYLEWTICYLGIVGIHGPYGPYHPYMVQKVQMLVSKNGSLDPNFLLSAVVCHNDHDEDHEADGRN